MKKLILLRHGQARDSESGSLDYIRDLTDIGKIEVTRTAKQLFEENFLPKTIISSTAKRAVITSQIASYVLEIPEAQIDYRHTLYNTLFHDYLDCIRGIDDSIDFAMIVGHNPVISQTVTYLSAAQYMFPTAGAAILHFENSTWNSISIGNGTLFDLIQP